MSTAVATPPAAAPASLPLHHSLVAGAPCEGRAGTRAVHNPATGEAFARVSLLDAAQAGDALDAARKAAPAWAALSFEERGRVLLKARALLAAQSDEVGRLIEQEQGKPLPEAQLAEIVPALESLKHLALHAEEVLREDVVESQVLLYAHKDARLQYAPLGVVLVITPWNYPFSISMNGVAAALMAGNAAVLKPAPATTLIGLRVGQILREAGLPDGVLSVVASGDDVAAALVEDPRVDKIVFTGSVATGKRVMAAAAKNLTPVVLELGGKDPAIVCKDADLDRAAAGLVWGAFLNAGQSCASVERVYVEDSVADAFVAKVVEQTKKLRTGNPGAGEVDMGPLTMERQRSIVEDHVNDARKRGASILTGGEKAEGPGWFYPPTVLTNVDHGMRIMREETFGPVLPIMKVKDVDEAIRLANDSEYGLTASGWTRSEDTARRLQRELRAGVVSINDCLSSFGEPTAPWGGVKHSGVGRTHGLAGLREMVQVKYVTWDDSRRPMAWWYPYDAELRKLASAASLALHGGTLMARLRGHVAMIKLKRFWKRVRVVDGALNADKALD